MKVIGGKKKASLALEGVFSEDLLSSMSEINDNGAKLLFDVLKGKIKLKENELDAFGFEDTVNSFNENKTSIPEELTTDTEDSEVEKGKQLNLFTLTKEDVDSLKDKVAKKRNVAEGQMTIFAM